MEPKENLPNTSNPVYDRGQAIAKRIVELDMRAVIVFGLARSKDGERLYPACILDNSMFSHDGVPEIINGYVRKWLYAKDQRDPDGEDNIADSLIRK